MHYIRIFGAMILMMLCLSTSVHAHTSLSVDSADNKNSDVEKLSERPLTIQGCFNYPPFEFINDQGQADGFNVDIIRAVMKKNGIPYNIELVDRGTAVENLYSKKIDAVIGIIHTRERAKNAKFGIPLCGINHNIISREGEKYCSLDDLRGKSIIVQKDSWLHQFLLKSNITDKITPVVNIEDGLKELSDGKHDVMLCNNLSYFYLAKKHKIKGLSLYSTEVGSHKYSLATNNDNEELLYILNDGLQQIKATGEYDKIYNKWFGVYERKGLNKEFSLILSIFLLCIIILILFNSTLKSEVKRKTKELQVANQKLGLAIDAGNISAWLYDIQKQSFSQLHGEVICKNGSTISEFCEQLHPDDADKFKHEIYELSVGKKNTGNVIVRVVSKSNQYSLEKQYSYYESKMIVPINDNNEILYITGTQKDITKDVLLHNQLESFQTKTNFIIDSLGITLWDFDVKTQTFFSQNENALKINEMLSANKYIEFVHPDDKVIAQNFIMSMDGHKSGTISKEYRLLLPDTDTYNWFIMEAVAFKRDRTGQILNYTGLRRNSTKTKKLLEDMQTLRLKAEESNKLKSAFLANMSHEIRTPLNAIVGFSSLLASSKKATQEERNIYNDLIISNNNQLLNIIKDILDISKIEACTLDFENNDIEINNLFHEIELESQMINNKPDISIRIDYPAKSFVFESDRNRLLQVINNLIINAVKFTTAGQIHIGCETSNDNTILFYVKDTGCGIAAENLVKVFDRFEKLDKFKPGTGLGLYICKTIITSMNGKISVTSKVNKGSTFQFSVPTKYK